MRPPWSPTPDASVRPEPLARPSFRESRAVRAGTALHTCGVMSWKARACWSCSRGPGTFSPLIVVQAGGRVVLSGRGFYGAVHADGMFL